MKYKVIFTTGYEDDLDSLTQELKADVLLMGSDGNYYNPQFITIERVKNEFTNDKICYLEDNLVIMHKITKDNILSVIKELHEWHFIKRWQPLTQEQLEKYFFPMSDWIIFDIEV
jgi:hypothetical protein